MANKRSFELALGGLLAERERVGEVQSRVYRMQEAQTVRLLRYSTLALQAMSGAEGAASFNVKMPPVFQEEQRSSKVSTSQLANGWSGYMSNKEHFTMLGVQQCPTCGNPVPPGARFCGDCGQPFSQASGPGGESRFGHAPQTSPGEPLRAVHHQRSVPPVRAQQLSVPWSHPAPPSKRAVPMASGSSASGAARALKIALMIALVMVVLSGAGIGGYFLVMQGSSAGAQAQQGTGTTTATSLPSARTATPGLPTATPTPPPPTLALNGPAATDMDGLHIQIGGIDCGSWLVLKQQQYTYDEAALQQMKTYISAFASTTDYGVPIGYDSSGGGHVPYSSQLAAQLPPVPDTLAWVPGGGGCFANLDFTATGSQSIQITSIGVTFDADAIPNASAYQLLEICTVLGEQANSCRPGLSGAGPCYSATINLQGGPVGTQVEVPITSGSCPLPLTLDPTQPVAQEVGFYLNSVPVQELYRVRLTVTVTTTAGTTTLALPSSFTSTLAFAAASQFSCYGLNGTTFVQEPFAETGPVSETGQTTTWCI